MKEKETISDMLIRLNIHKDHKRIPVKKPYNFKKYMNFYTVSILAVMFFAAIGVLSCFKFIIGIFKALV